MSAGVKEFSNNLFCPLCLQYLVADPKFITEISELKLPVDEVSVNRRQFEKSFDPVILNLLHNEMGSN